MKLYEIDENIRDMYDMLSEGVMAFPYTRIAEQVQVQRYRQKFEGLTPLVPTFSLPLYSARYPWLRNYPRAERLSVWALPRAGYSYY